MFRVGRVQSLANGVFITRLRLVSGAGGANPTSSGWQPRPSLKVCITSGLTKKEIEKAGVVIRHAVTKVMTRKNSSARSAPL